MKNFILRGLLSLFVFINASYGAFSEEAIAEAGGSRLAFTEAQTKIAIATLKELFPDSSYNNLSIDDARALTEIDLSAGSYIHYQDVGDEELSELAKNVVPGLPALEAVLLDGCYGISIGGVKELAQAMTEHCGHHSNVWLSVSNIFVQPFASVPLDVAEEIKKLKEDFSTLSITVFDH